ncbi:hypothetical protein PEBR_03218 [Penicillium brasilianum]|uniref:Uncharacterized protein n=1 Tax=Penicillium brasilianum TaxID=104259 RepID=A0A1S9RZD1_PENBI|nr:hypothetical protein PEBR_03218 [Penicillium brasilianum]
MMNKDAVLRTYIDDYAPVAELLDEAKADTATLAQFQDVLHQYQERLRPAVAAKLEQLKNIIPKLAPKPRALAQWRFEHIFATDEPEPSPKRKADALGDTSDSEESGSDDGMFNFIADNDMDNDNMDNGMNNDE